MNQDASFMCTAAVFIPSRMKEASNRTMCVLVSHRLFVKHRPTTLRVNMRLVRGGVDSLYFDTPSVVYCPHGGWLAPFLFCTRSLKNTTAITRLAMMPSLEEVRYTSPVPPSDPRCGRSPLTTQTTHALFTCRSSRYIDEPNELCQSVPSRV